MAGLAPKVELPQFGDLKVIIISASWHLDICSALVEGARRGFESSGIEYVPVRRVSGSFELALAAQLAFDEGFDLAVVVGVVIRGDTPHFDYLCQGVTKGVVDVSLSRSKPIGFGVLMCDTLEQAVDRSGMSGSKEDKGYDSAIAALSILAKTNF